MFTSKVGKMLFPNQSLEVTGCEGVRQLGDRDDRRPHERQLPPDDPARDGFARCHGPDDLGHFRPPREPVPMKEDADARGPELLKVLSV